MAKIKVLIPGYTSADSGEEKTCATITLIQDKNLTIVVDPGVLESQKVLVDALNKEGVAVKDVNIVCLTHSHIDHYRNIGMFPNAKTLEFYGLWNKNTVQDWNEQFSDDIKIIKTPGHDKTSITLLVKTDKGVVAVCGDVFWKENFPAKDPYADNPKQLEKTRERLLEISDWIVPGHADMYKVKKNNSLTK